uniref:Uncharacterized protein n=1 Tax=Romanomermis culicivorax TaxID=13658 RepID=A0A915L4M6_ROMCU
MKKIKKTEKIKRNEKQFGAETAFAKIAGTEIAGAKTASAEMTVPKPNWLAPKRRRRKWSTGTRLSVLCMTLTLVCH